MKIYLASRYSRHEEMRGVRDRLATRGHSVTSRWIDLHNYTAPTSASPDILNNDPLSVAKYAIHDYADIVLAEAVISFTGHGGKGGRHVEFGIGLALGKTSVIVGPRENVFHALSGVYVFPDVQALMDNLKEVEGS